MMSLTNRESGKRTGWRTTPRPVALILALLLISALTIGYEASREGSSVFRATSFDIVMLVVTTVGWTFICSRSARGDQPGMEPYAPFVLLVFIGQRCFLTGGLVPWLAAPAAILWLLALFACFTGRPRAGCWLMALFGAAALAHGLVGQR